MKKNLKKILAEKTITLEEFSRDFTSRQKKVVEEEIRYYDVLIDLKRNRKELGLTQAELAQKADIPRTTVTKIESGTYNPTLQTLMTIASAMDKKLQIKLA